MNNIVTGKVRLSFVHVFEAREQENGDAKYSVTMLIPKSDTETHNKIVNGIKEALNEGVNKVFGGVAPANPKIPIYDGDGLRPNGEAFGDECKGCWVLTANSIKKPEVVDANVQPILSAGEVYSGCYGRVSIRFFAYNKNGNKGVGCGLGNVQKLEDGEKLAGGTSAKEDFGSPTQTQNNPVQNAIDGQNMLNNILGL